VALKAKMALNKKAGWFFLFIYAAGFLFHGFNEYKLNRIGKTTSSFNARINSKLKYID
jgi:hypothetical protein